MVEGGETRILINFSINFLLIMTCKNNFILYLMIKCHHNLVIRRLSNNSFFIGLMVVFKVRKKYIFL